MYYFVEVIAGKVVRLLSCTSTKSLMPSAPGAKRLQVTKAQFQLLNATDGDLELAQTLLWDLKDLIK
jgi:hypothetical protein